MTVATLLLGLLPGLLAGIPGISSKILQIIKDITSSASIVLASGVISTPNVNTVLAAWLGVLTALQSDPALPVEKLAYVKELTKAVQAALVQDVQASMAVDWSKLSPIAPV